MDLFFFIPAISSLVLFILAMVRFPPTSFQYTILLFVAALFMFLSTLMIYVPTTTTSTQYPAYNVITYNSDIATTANIVTVATNPAYTINVIENPIPNATVIALTNDVSYLYMIVCFTFALIGIVLKLTEGVL